jgi:carbamoyltransferase
VGHAVSDPWVLGLAASHHGAVCLMHGHQIVAAIQEERLTREKYAPLAPARGFRGLHYVLDAAGIGVDDLDLVVLCPLQPPSAPLNDLWRHPTLGSRPRMVISHHLGHAAAAYGCSGYPEATVLVVDAMGSRVEDLADDERDVVTGPATGREVMSIYRARGASLTAIEKHAARHPDVDDDGDDRPRMFPFASLGFMYQTVAEQIFGSWHDSGKLMGLAAHGEATAGVDDFLSTEGGQLRFADIVPKRFRHLDRWPARQREYADLAASTQSALEEGLAFYIDLAAARGQSRNFCYAGGVALNILANERLLYRGYRFDDVFVQPAAEDCGTAIGAALCGVWRLTGEHRPQRVPTDFLGKSYGAGAAAHAAEVARLLADGAVVGWFDGGAEFGPRALGHRSLLADPRRQDTKPRLDRIKHREPFRPYAPAILEEHAPGWFDLGPTSPVSPLMLRAPRFLAGRAGEVPAVVHVDGSGRVQTVPPEAGGLRRVIDAFHALTGVPMVLNTSLNQRGQPMVETPDEAIALCQSMDLDACVVDARLCRR